MKNQKAKSLFRIRREGVDWKKIILDTLAVGGAMTLAVMAPNALRILPMLGLSEKKFKPSYVYRKVRELEQKGLVKFETKNGYKYANLTDKGEKLLERYRAHAADAASRKKWDGKWRVVIFDIKEYRRSDRDNLRYELYNFGFQKLQNSVWVSPYPCEEFILLLKADLKIGKSVLYMTVENMEGDAALKERFGLLGHK